MRARRVVGGVIAGGVVVSAALGGLGYVIARRVTAPVGPRRFDLVVRGVDVSEERVIVILTRTAQTATPGLFNLILENGTWVKLSEKVLDVSAELVGREVVGDVDPEALTVGTRASWSGMYFKTPADAGFDAIDVEVSTEFGSAPAWLIPPTDVSQDIWAVHIHGLGSHRAGTLRGVQVAADAGLTSLVVTYRNDGEGPSVGSARSTLGATETDDVEAAVRYAIDHGAGRVVLFGWSMGGTIALELAVRSALRDRVAGLVLESPVLDWVETIKANCGRAGLPKSAGALAVPWLDSSLLAHCAGLTAPIGLKSVASVERARTLQIPAIVLHGARDTSVSVDLVAQLAHSHSTIRTEEFDADHTMTWNVEPDRWRTRVGGLLAQVSRHKRQSIDPARTGSPRPCRRPGEMRDDGIG
ncbi:alpha/beta fold hydrolase [Agromyces endophyticus]|uniref:alpha/beta hydrolase family protein n=1 Tax=Agromyces sp. H17E-10 TaxID=2932244 RepID=UPI001FD46030|nr:alpha/beta fold hydrolase [Agromyces sp. H17E-10]UOQ89204.1 alpha/beta fold hydrolase [Agromyces sp. H17E-10]